MPDRPADIARALTGVRFRLHGRSPEHGLDCIGLVALAYRRNAPTGYPLRGITHLEMAQRLRQLGFVRRRRAPRRDDLIVVAPGPLQLHLGVWTGSSLIHADAGLGRVVESPGPPRWPVLSIWFSRRGRR